MSNDIKNTDFDRLKEIYNLCISTDGCGDDVRKEAYKIMCNVKKKIKNATKTSGSFVIPPAPPMPGTTRVTPPIPQAPPLPPGGIPKAPSRGAQLAPENASATSRDTLLASIRESKPLKKVSNSDELRQQKELLKHLATNPQSAPSRAEPSPRANQQPSLLTQLTTTLKNRQSVTEPTPQSAPSLTLEPQTPKERAIAALKKCEPKSKTKLIKCIDNIKDTDGVLYEKIKKIIDDYKQNYYTIDDLNNKIKEIEDIQSGGDYYIKYLKYKLKYLDLMKHDN